MELNQLTESEVYILIQSLKNFKKKINIDTTMSGRIKRDDLILGVHDGIEYKLHLYRHPLQSDRYSIHLRFTENNHHLIRVDVNNGSHRNPDGKVVKQNHFHIYKYEEGLTRDAYAFPLETKYSDLTSIFDALEQFLKYNNIQTAK